MMTYGYILGSFWLVILSNCLKGFFIIGMFPVMLDLILETSYPTDEIYSQSFLSVFIFIFSNFVVTLASFLIKNLEKEGSLICLYLSIGLIALAFINSLFIKEDFKRLKFEQQKSYESIKVVVPDIS